MSWYMMPLADEAAGAPARNPTGELVSFVLLMGAVLVVFYFILIRPQKKQEQRRREMINALSKGDRVVTIGGIVGQVTDIDENIVTLKVDARKDVEMKFRKSAVAALFKEKKEEDQQA